MNQAADGARRQRAPRQRRGGVGVLTAREGVSGEEVRGGGTQERRSPGGGAIWWPRPSGKKGPGSRGSLGAAGRGAGGGWRGWMPKGVLSSGPSQPSGPDAPRRLGRSSPQHLRGTRKEARARWPAAPRNCLRPVSLRGVRPPPRLQPGAELPTPRREEGCPGAPAHPGAAQEGAGKGEPPSWKQTVGEGASPRWSLGRD